MLDPQHEQKYDALTFSDMCVDLILSGQDVTPHFGQVEKLVEDYTLELGGMQHLRLPGRQAGAAHGGGEGSEGVVLARAVKGGLTVDDVWLRDCGGNGSSILSAR